MISGRFGDRKQNGGQWEPGERGEEVTASRSRAAFRVMRSSAGPPYNDMNILKITEVYT